MKIYGKYPCKLNLQANTDYSSFDGELKPDYADPSPCESAAASLVLSMVAKQLDKLDSTDCVSEDIFRAFQDACDRIDDRAKKQLELTLLTDPDYRLEAVMFSGGCSNAGSVISVSEDDMK